MPRVGGNSEEGVVNLSPSSLQGLDEISLVKEK